MTQVGFTRAETNHFTTTETTDSCSTAAKTEKGCFVVYSADQKWFRLQLPLEYLSNEIIRELLDMEEEEFGLPSNGPLTLPCDSELLEYTIALIKQRDATDVERAFITSIASSCSSFHLYHQSTLHQTVINTARQEA